MTTRTKILEAAEQLFTERGYHATTLREVAERVGITKPALYYHFESKSEILASLLDPMTTELEQVLVKSASAGDLPALRRVLLTGWLDVFLRSRGALLALFRDLAAMPPALYHRLLVVLEQAVTLGAGAGANLADQVTMAQAISAITDPVALVPHIPTEELREHLLAGVWRLIGEPPPQAESALTETPSHNPTQPTPTAHQRPVDPASTDPERPAPSGINRARSSANDHDPTQPPPNTSPHQAQSASAGTSGNQPAQPAPAHASDRRGGRPRALSPADVKHVRELHASGEHTADSIAALLGVSRATVYRCLKT